MNTLQKFLMISTTMGVFLVSPIASQMVASAEPPLAKHRRVLPSPDEVRSFEALPNRLVAVSYANGRIYLFPINKINPRPDCSTVRFEGGRLVLMTQATRQAYEYVLDGIPIKVNGWEEFGAGR
jgi:hypothetical protein